MSNLERLKEIFAELFGDEVNLDEINEESRLFIDIEMTSIAMLSLAMSIEEEFSMQFRNEDFDNIKTVGDVLRCIER
ncbi:MAG: acyl carrier protein [Ruminococcus sp.]|nr:phosphopantetheine-binding protein [Oscillospiraceae bacterium]